MSPDFKYFFWGMPELGKPVYTLYDVFDNHMYIQSPNQLIIQHLRQLVRSKILLDVVEINDPHDLDNSVIELRGLAIPPDILFSDIRAHDQYIIRDPELTEVDPKFDNFKTDLQRQLFFFNYCLSNCPVENNQYLPEVYSVFRTAAELSMSYNDAVDRLLDLTPLTDKTTIQHMLYFLNHSGLFYE